MAQQPNTGRSAKLPIVFLITKWQGRKSYDSFYKAANTYLVLAGIGLFLYQMYGYFQGH